MSKIPYKISNGTAFLGTSLEVARVTFIQRELYDSAWPSSTEGGSRRKQGGALKPFNGSLRPLRPCHIEPRQGVFLTYNISSDGQPEPDTRSFPVLSGVVAQLPQRYSNVAPCLYLHGMRSSSHRYSLRPITLTASEPLRHHPVLEAAGHGQQHVPRRRSVWLNPLRPTGGIANRFVWPIVSEGGGEVRVHAVTQCIHEISGQMQMEILRCAWRWAKSSRPHVPYSSARERQELADGRKPRKPFTRIGSLSVTRDDYHFPQTHSDSMPVMMTAPRYTNTHTSVSIYAELVYQASCLLPRGLHGYPG